MRKIVIFDPEKAPFRSPRDAYPPDVVQLISDRELDRTAVRWHHPGGGAEPQLFEMRLEPDTRLEPHAHEASEIIAVLAGSLVVAGSIYGPGASFLVPGGTVYSVASGPDGCRFLNFRSAADTTYFTARQALSRLRGEANGTGR